MNPKCLVCGKFVKMISVRLVQLFGDKTRKHKCLLMRKYVCRCGWETYPYQYDSEFIKREKDIREENTAREYAKKMVGYYDKSP